MKPIPIQIALVIAFATQAQTNNFPLYSSGDWSGGSGDLTNITNPHLKLNASTGYPRSVFTSAHSSVSTVFNFQTGKNVYWGEPTDGGSYIFRGRDIIIEQGKLDVAGLATTAGLRIPGRYTFGNSQSGIEMEVPADSYNAVRGYSGTQHIGTIHFFDDTWQGGASGSSAGAINLSALTAVTIGNWSSPTAYFKSDGSVGIGTTNPNGKLDLVVNNSYQRISGNTSSFVAADLYIQRSSSLPGLGRSSAIQLQDTGSGDQVMLQGGSGGFQVFNTTSAQPWTERLRITHSGDVGIGTATPDAKLSVKGQIHAQEVKVDLNGAVAPDYVFNKDYNLLSLEEIKSYIETNKHLPEVPSAKEMEANGLKLGEMNLLLLKKVEELTLYILHQEKNAGQLRAEVAALRSLVETIQNK
jgi:hypothetical protein